MSVGWVDNEGDEGGGEQGGGSGPWGFNVSMGPCFELGRTKLSVRLLGMS